MNKDETKAMISEYQDAKIKLLESTNKLLIFIINKMQEKEKKLQECKK